MTPLERLQLVAGLERDRRLAALRAAATERAGLQHRRAALQAEIHRAAAAADAEPALGKACEALRSWAQRRDLTLQHELQRCDAALAKAQDHAARAVGRDHALETLAERLRTDGKQAIQRRMDLG